MTKQEYYDLLVRSARDGTFPSVSDTGVYLYRGPQGKKCAIGLLIPDNLYQEDIEGEGLNEEVLGILRRADTIPDGLFKEDLDQIQAAHDICTKKIPGRDWDSSKFIQKINELPCFVNIVKEKL